MHVHACACVIILIFFLHQMIELFYSKMCELIVYLYNDTGNDYTEGSDICMALCIINLNSLLIIPSCTRKGSLSCRHQWLIGPSIILPSPSKWILHSWIWLLFTRENCPNTAVFHIKDQMSERFYFQIRDRILK